MKSLTYEPVENANMLSKPNSTTLAAIILIKAISNSLTKISLRFGKFLTLSVLCIHCAIVTMFFLCFPFMLHYRWMMILNLTREVFFYNYFNFRVCVLLYTLLFYCSSILLSFLFFFWFLCTYVTSVVSCLFIKSSRVESNFFGH